MEYIQKKLPAQKFNNFVIWSYLIQNNKIKYPLKHQTFYKGIINNYHLYPKTIEKLIDNINNIGIYKDYLYFIKHSIISENNIFEEFIINHIVSAINNDIENMKNNKKISLLCKWLPNEQSDWQKTYKIVDKISYKLFNSNNTMNDNDIKNIHSRRRRYRKLIVNMRRYNNLPKEHKYTGKFELMDPKSMDLNFVNINIKEILNNEELSKRLTTKYYLNYVTKSIFEISYLYHKEKLNVLQKKALNKLWDEKKNIYTSLIGINNKNVIIDIGSYVSNSGKKYSIMMYGLLCKLKNKNVYINDKKLREFDIDTENNSLCDILDEFTFENTNINDPSENIVDLQLKDYIFITNRNIKCNFENFKSLILIYNNQKKKHDNCFSMDYKPKENIYLKNLKEILNESPELYKQKQIRKNIIMVICIIIFSLIIFSLFFFI